MKASTILKNLLTISSLLYAASAIASGSLTINGNVAAVGCYFKTPSDALELLPMSVSDFKGNWSAAGRRHHQIVVQCAAPYSKYSKITFGSNAIDIYGNLINTAQGPGAAKGIDIRMQIGGYSQDFRRPVTSAQLTNKDSFNYEVSAEVARIGDSVVTAGTVQAVINLTLNEV